MATPYVPVPIPIGSSTSFTTNRNQRRSSLGSISTSSSSSKGQLEDSSFKKMSVPDEIGATSSPCNSPLVRTKFVGMNSSMEYCTQPSEDTTQNTDSGSWEDRPTTPTILGYEVMEERAKFTVSYGFLISNPSSFEGFDPSTLIFEDCRMFYEYYCNFTVSCKTCVRFLVDFLKPFLSCPCCTRYFGVL